MSDFLRAVGRLQYNSNLNSAKPCWLYSETPIQRTGLVSTKMSAILELAAIFWTTLLLHKLKIFYVKQHTGHLEALNSRMQELFWHFNQRYDVSPPMCSQNYTCSLTITQQNPIFGQNVMVYTINLKILVRYNGVFGFQDFQKSVKYGPIYFNEKWSAEKCPLNWSCPLFLESAKLEFHCITLLFCGSVIPRRRKKRGCFIFCERWKSLAFSSRSFMRKPDFVITNTGPLIV